MGVSLFPFSVYTFPMPTLRVPALMKSYVENQTEVTLSGATIAEALNDLVTRHPAIKTHILDKNGELRRYVNLFVNDANIKDLGGVETLLGEADKIILLPSISGG
jgi:molybdopterin synthase sulfur carrier subunit